MNHQPASVPQRIAPAWGIAGIVSLVAVMGIVVHQRFSKEDRSWTRWEKHELTGTVLGQSPEPKTSTPKVPSVQTPAQRSSVPPLWSQSGATRSESSRAPVELAASAPEQSEDALLDPFSMPAGEPSRPATMAPRTLPAENQVSKQKSASVPPREMTLPAGQARPIRDPSLTPAHLDFATSDRGESDAATAAKGKRFQRIQQTSATDGDTAEDFAEPLSFGGLQVPSTPEPTPAYRPTAVGADSGFVPVAGEVPEQRSLPQFEMQAELPEVGNIQPTPAPITNRATPPMGISEPQLGNLTPIANPQTLPEPSQIPAQAPLQGLPSLDDVALPMKNEPAPTPVRVERPASPPASPSTPSGQDPFMGTQQSAPLIVNDPVPSAGFAPRQPASASIGTTPATQAPVLEREIRPDEIYQVQPGDNYWTISRRFYSSARFFSALAEYNKHRIPSPEKMKPGMYVLVPDVEVLHQRYPQLTGGGPRDPAETAPPGFFVDSNGQPCYRVGKGDTLSDIAQAYLGRSSRWVQIQAMNRDKLTDGQPLKIGMVLKLPADASQVSLAPSETDVR